VRAGSVPVHDLITREIPKVVDPPPPEHAARPPGNTPEPPARPRTHRRPPSRGAQVAKVAGLGAAVVALCGAVAAGTMIAGERSAADQPSAGQPDVEITGAQALLPDKLNATLPPSGAVAPPGTTSAQPSTTDPPAPEPDGSGDARSVDDTHAALPGPLTDAQLVEHFYELLPSAPADAFQLLSPDLLDGDVGQFLRSWSTVSDLEVLNLADHGDDVLAIVRMRLDDGSTLRVQQLLSVADDPREIVGVELLSAQRN
jgi:hypothetical protein